MAEPWDDLFAEAGLPAEEYAGVRSALAELREAPLPALEPSEQLAALLAGGASTSRRRAGWLPAVAALVAVSGGGVSAAAAFGTLPDPVQEFMHEVSDTLLPFEFPEPEPETRDDVGPPGVPSGTPGAPPGVVPGQGIKPLPSGDPTFPPGAAPSARPAAVPAGAGDRPGGPGASGPGNDPLESIAPGGVPPVPSHHLPTRAPGAPSGLPSKAPTNPAVVEHTDHPAADPLIDSVEEPHPTRSPGQQGSHGPPTHAP